MVAIQVAALGLVLTVETAAGPRSPGVSPRGWDDLQVGDFQRRPAPRYEAVSECVTERVLREDKSHSTGLTMSDPPIMVPNEP